MRDLDEVDKYYLIDDYDVVKTIAQNTVFSKEDEESIASLAQELICEVKSFDSKALSLESLLSTFKLSTKEGVALMCLAEALFRVPDSANRNNLIKDKLMGHDWSSFISKNNLYKENIISLGISAAEKILSSSQKVKISTLSDPIIRTAIVEAVKIICKEFIFEKNINSAIKKSKTYQDKGYSFSFDMLGEGARTKDDAEKYFANYINSIKQIENNIKNFKSVEYAGVSIKISAIHPKYHYSKISLYEDQIYSKLKDLCLIAKNIGLTIIIDAEEADRLDFCLRLIERLIADDNLSDKNTIGLALQAYQKRAFYVLDYLLNLAQKHNRRIPVRLVKGAYWDYEIKNSQEHGDSSYPVFRRKRLTDLSYIACAYKMMQNINYFYPQFATHNANTIAAIIKFHEKLNVDFKEFEFQRLWGMGDNLYLSCLKRYPSCKVRIYAPVGEYEELLPYLVRRLLENSANSSFVSKLNDKNKQAEDLLENPLALNFINEVDFKEFNEKYIVAPSAIYKFNRKNSIGLNLALRSEQLEILNYLQKPVVINAYSIIDGQEVQGDLLEERYCPADKNLKIGSCSYLDKEQIELAIDCAYNFGPNWGEPEMRAEILDKLADLIESDFKDYVAQIVFEGGRVINDAISEVREAIDFCRYYALQIRKNFVQKEEMDAVTGESNMLSYEGKGLFFCISPWNFPMAIFLGQVTAALAAGNSVIAKPADHTPLVAYKLVKQCYEAGIPKQALQFVIAKGNLFSEIFKESNKIKGVAFTGSTGVAKKINQNLAFNKGDIATLIAETGGLNAMIVDSSCLLEQTIDDVIESAFSSAGQRCSALRVLYVQEDIYNKFIAMLKGAMAEIVIGYPWDIATDVGPVITEEVINKFDEHCKRIEKQGKLIFKCNALKHNGSYYPPVAYEVDSIKVIEEEIFGPVLHVVNYKMAEIDRIIDDINSTGYGLTFGVHSRVDSFIEKISDKVRAGNVYINRNIIGAVVGAQPFGGMGLSGTGPKAGGPNYLKRFSTEKLVCNNLTASGGNIALYIIDED